MKKALAVLIAALIFITAAVVCKNVYSCEIPIKNRGIRDAVNSGDLEVLFLGSSTFRANIDMNMMDEAYDNAVYDVSYGGNHMVAASIQYDEIKKRSVSDHDLIAFEMGPLILTQEVALSDSRVIWDLSWEGKKELYESMKDAGSMTLGSTYEYFVTSGMDDLLTYFVTEPFYSTRYYKGAKTDAASSPGKEVLENEKFDISEDEIVKAQADAVRDIVRKCKRDGQDLIFIESPCYHRLSEDEKYRKCLQEFKDILDEEGADYILASDVDFDDHDPDLFEDMNHMSDKGRKEYTGSLLRILKERR